MSALFGFDFILSTPKFYHTIKLVRAKCAHHKIHAFSTYFIYLFFIEFFLLNI